MKIEIYDLLIVQEKVHKEILKKASREFGMGDLLLAFEVELFELINAIGTWKWWKNSHKIDKNKVLDELADVIAFYLEMLYMNRKLRSDNSVDSILTELVESFKEFDSNQLAVSLAIVFEGSAQDSSISIDNMMALAITIVSQNIDVTWDEIVEAYLNKSDVNIERQENDY